MLAHITQKLHKETFQNWETLIILFQYHNSITLFLFRSVTTYNSRERNVCRERNISRWSSSKCQTEHSITVMQDTTSQFIKKKKKYWALS